MMKRLIILMLIAATMQQSAIANEDTGFNVSLDHYLKPSNSGANDAFGHQISISGDLMVIGAPNEQSGVGGINPGGLDNGTDQSGIAYVYRNGPDGWVQEVILKAPTPQRLGYFGSSVALSGNRILVGAPNQDGMGRAFLYLYQDDAWILEATLAASDGEAGDYFGNSVGLSGTRAIVGAPGEDSGDPDDPEADPTDACCVSSSGAAYTYELNTESSQWIQTARLKAGRVESSAGFGLAVDISGRYAIVGAPAQDSIFDWDRTEFYSAPADGIRRSGGAYIFQQTGETWRQSAFLRGNQSFSDAHFGDAVSIEGNIAVVGAARETVNVPGTNGGTTPFVSTGAVYIFTRYADTWLNSYTLNASNPQGGDLFGNSVDLQGTRLIVGAPGEDGGSMWGSGTLDPGNNTSFNSGAAYVFEKRGELWEMVQYLKASNTGEFDAFGLEVAISDRVFAVGAPAEDGPRPEPGTIPSTDIDSVMNSGAVYVYSETSPAGAPFQIIGNNIGIPEGSTEISTFDGTEFGKVKPGSSIGHSFLVQNRSDSMAIITGIESSNPAFSATTLSELPLDLPRGGIIEFEVIYAPADSGSIDNSEITLRFDHPDRNSLTFAVRGYPNPDSLDIPGDDRKFTIPGAESSGLFGRTLSASDDLIAVGAFRQDDPDGISEAGIAYLFERSGGMWEYKQPIAPPDPQPSGYFSYSLTTGDNIIAAGAPGWDMPAESDGGEPIENTGTVFIFSRNEQTGEWSFTQQLLNESADPVDSFGASVAVSGNRLIVGAPDEDSESTGISGDPANNGLENSGAAFIYTHDIDNNTWVLEEYIKASNTDNQDGFGWSVDIDGDLAVVGAPYESSSANTIDGNQLNNIFFAAGAAYVFRNTADGWVQEAYLKPSNPGSQDNFGWSVSIHGNRIAVGAPNEDSDGSDQTNNRLSDSGSAYVFEFIDESWVQTAVLKASQAHEGYGLGATVSIHGDLLVCGAFSDRSSAPGLNSGATNSDAPESGAVHVFQKSGDSWTPRYYIKHSEPSPFDRFGFAAALTSNSLAVTSLNKLTTDALGFSARQGELSIYALDELPDFLPSSLLDLSIQAGTLQVKGDYGVRYRIQSSGDLESWSDFDEVNGLGFDIPAAAATIDMDTTPVQFFRLLQPQ
jgi:hypothetical protein